MGAVGLAASSGEGQSGYLGRESVASVALAQRCDFSGRGRGLGSQRPVLLGPGIIRVIWGADAPRAVGLRLGLTSGYSRARGQVVPAVLVEALLGPADPGLGEALACRLIWGGASEAKRLC